jgi:hypothetical protein
MLRKTFAVMLSGLLLLTTLGSQQVWAQTPSDTQAAEKLRARVQKIGIGPNARVAVQLRNHSRLRGYISSSDQDSFTVIDSQTGTSKTMSYADASTVKKAGGGGSLKPWLILGGVAAAVGVTWLIVKPALCDGGAQTRGPC